MQRLWTKEERLALYEDYVVENDVKMNPVSMWVHKQSFLVTAALADAVLSWFSRREWV